MKSLKLWKILFVDESHLLIKMAREETVCDAEIRADAQRINQAASQPAFFILYNIELGKILSICENSSTNLCQVLINFQARRKNITRIRLTIKTCFRPNKAFH